MGQINDLLDESLSKIKTMMSGNSVVGDPIVYNNVTILPITSIRLAFLSGGSDMKSEKDIPLFGGATSGGVSVTPSGFLIIKDDMINFIAVDNKTHIYEKIIEYVSGVLNKGSNLVRNNVDI